MCRITFFVTFDTSFLSKPQLLPTCCIHQPANILIPYRACRIIIARKVLCCSVYVLLHVCLSVFLVFFSSSFRKMDKLFCPRSQLLTFSGRRGVDSFQINNVVRTVSCAGNFLYSSIENNMQSSIQKLPNFKSNSSLYVAHLQIWVFQGEN